VALGFAGFLRCSELLRLKRSDVHFAAGALHLYIRGAKTDKFNKGQRVTIGASGCTTCPVAALRLYMDRYVPPSPDSWLFCTISGASLSTTPLAYSRCLELIKEAIAAIGLNPAAYGTHSMRRGGATAAAAAGVSDRRIQVHGRRKSVSARNLYIVDSFPQAHVNTGI